MSAYIPTPTTSICVQTPTYEDQSMPYLAIPVKVKKTIRYD